jgi:hypothetical protein
MTWSTNYVLLYMDPLDLTHTPSVLFYDSSELGIDFQIGFATSPLQAASLVDNFKSAYFMIKPSTRPSKLLSSPNDDTPSRSIFPQNLRKTQAIAPNTRLLRLFVSYSATLFRSGHTANITLTPFVLNLLSSSEDRSERP